MIPTRATLFVQSDVPEVSELCWLLMTGTPMGLLERCHAYKDKKAKGLTADAGLFTYPVLMAADILAYDADIVPVGEDQVQHIEVCRDLAGSFNHQFGETFVLPKAKVLDQSAKVPGTDGEKMSKSYGNTLEIFEDPKAQRKQIMRITTDSRPMEEPKDPETDHLYQLYSLFADETAREEMAAMYRRGGFGYGEVKKALAEAAEAYFAPARQRREEFAGDPQRVQRDPGRGGTSAGQGLEVLLEPSGLRPQVLNRDSRDLQAGARCALPKRRPSEGPRRTMNILGIGTDIVECLRIAQMIERHGELFVGRVYTTV